MKQTLLYLLFFTILGALVFTLVGIAGNWNTFVPRAPNKLGSIVRLVNEEGMTFCTGTVLSADIILTAAHCVLMESAGSEPNYRTPIEVRPADNTSLGVYVTAIFVRFQMDQAILKGTFSKFSYRKYITDVGELTLLKGNTKLMACGYPLGGPLYCGRVYYDKPNMFFWKVRGTLIPGMSGGCVLDSEGSVVATNVAVEGPYSIISPIYNLDIDINRKEK